MADQSLTPADRPAPPEGALERILKNRPALYDPDIVAAARAELAGLRERVAEIDDRGPLSLHRDEHGYADAIDRDGTCLLHLRAGTERNVCNAQSFVDEFNALRAAARHGLIARVSEPTRSPTRSPVCIDLERALNRAVQDRFVTEPASPSPEGWAHPVPLSPLEAAPPAPGRVPLVTNQKEQPSMPNETNPEFPPDLERALRATVERLERANAGWIRDWETIAEAAGEKPDVMVTSLRGRIVNKWAECARLERERDAWEVGLRRACEYACCGEDGRDRSLAALRERQSPEPGDLLLAIGKVLANLWSGAEALERERDEARGELEDWQMAAREACRIGEHHESRAAELQGEVERLRAHIQKWPSVSCPCCGDEGAWADRFAEGSPTSCGCGGVVMFDAEEGVSIELPDGECPKCRASGAGEG